jgi:hypothetical protein
MFVYMTENLVTGKRYIGLCTRETDSYLGSGKLIKSAIKKYGKESFKRTILEECSTFDQLSAAEAKWIEFYDAVNSKQFYNIAHGGFGGNSQTVKKYWDSLTEVERLERVKKHRGHNVKGEHNPMYGRSTSTFVKKKWDERSEEERKSIGQKVSKTKRERGIGKGESNPMYGRSAVTEKNLKWYTDGVNNIYVTEGTQPESYNRGRITKWMQKK